MCSLLSHEWWDPPFIWEEGARIYGTSGVHNNFPKNIFIYLRKIIRYSWSTINTYSLISHEWRVSIINLISGTHYSCERKEHTFIILREYIIIPLYLHTNRNLDDWIEMRRMDDSLDLSEMEGNDSYILTRMYNLPKKKMYKIFWPFQL